ncbi:MAG: DNA repair protein RadC [Planctomycetes bacterium]|nr:DNA repair protein RadC [Planctomycetota bacterium]
MRRPIRTWPETERPRERLMSLGPQNLSDAELLAILLRVGTPGKSAVDLGRDLLERFGTLRSLARAPLEALSGVRGVKGAKAAQLAAAMEVARRVALPDRRRRVSLGSTRRAARYLSARLRDLGEEHFRVLYLDRLNRLIDDALIAQGEPGSVHVSVRSVISGALRRRASGMIVAHNHPTGRAEPSEEDRTLTRELSRAAGAVGVKLLDHVIVGDGKTFSFADRGLLDELD